MPQKRPRVEILSSIKRNRLLFCPVAIAAAIRGIGAVWLYHLLSLGGEFHTAWMDANPRLIPEWSPILNPSTSSNWLWLFNAWDSLHFQLIAQLGYSFPDYVYLPGYPIFIRMVGFMVGNYWLGGFLVAQIFALASLVVFQLLAEQYMQPREALCATLLMATFPYISVFTILGYSEAVFLFSTIATWYFYKKGQIGTSSLLAGLASITRIYGLAIVLPMCLDIVRSKNYRKLLYLAIPVAFVASWFLFCYASTGDPFASWTDEKWFTSNIDSKDGLVQTILSQALKGVIGCCTLDPGILIAVGLFAYLVVKTWQVDGSLSIYAVTVFASVTSTATNHLALLRFLTFLFPVWLTIKVRNLVVVAGCIAFFVPVTLLLWLYAINVTFIG